MTKPHKPAPLPPLDAMLCFSIYRAGLAFNQFYRKVLDEYQLTYPQFLALIALQQNGSMRVSDLGAVLSLESNTLTPLLKRLQSAAFVCREKGKQDGRETLVTLTDQGRKLVADLGCIAPQVGAAAQMTPAQAADLTGRLKNLAAALRSHSANH